MNILSWCIRIALFLLVLVFSVRNTELVTVNWAPGFATQSPLVLALLGAFLLGAVFAWLMLLPSWWKAKRNAAAAGKALAKAEKSVSTSQNQTAPQAGAPDENLLALPIGPTHGV